MPFPYHLLNALSNHSLSVAERKVLEYKLSDYFFKHAMACIQKRAETHGKTENGSGRSKDGHHVAGLMQASYDSEATTRPTPKDHVNVNFSINEFYTGENTKKRANLRVGSIKDLLPSGKLLSAEDYNGFYLACLDNCRSIEIINPYSNIYYYGMQLIKHLSPITTNTIPYIFVPVLNHILCPELIIKYYQPELYRFSVLRMFDFADEFTPEYLRCARRLQILFEAIQLYEKLASEVAELFTPEVRERIKTRILYRTVFMLMPELTQRLLEWMQQLSDSSPQELKMLAEYQELFDQVAGCVTRSMLIVQAYISDLDSNLGWRFGQPRYYCKSSDNAFQLLPLAENDQQLLVDESLGIMQSIQQRLYKSKEFLNKYAGVASNDVTIQKLALPVFTAVSTADLRWLTTIHLYVLKDGLETAINNKQIRDKILEQLHARVKNIILTDEQLVNIYNYVLTASQHNGVRRNLRELPLESDVAVMSGSSLLFSRKTSQGELRDPRLFRTICITRSNKGYKIFLIPNGKFSDAKRGLPKFIGGTASVTAQFDISPYNVEELDPVQATKSIDLAAANDEKEIIARIERIKQSVSIARKMGHIVGVGSRYRHVKTMRDNRQELRAAIRITEKWMPTTLLRVAVDDGLKEDSVLNMDVDYKQAKSNGDPQVLAAAKQIIHFRLVGNLLQDLSKLHDILNIVHMDVKPENILISRDNDGRMCARLTDFSISEYMCDIQRHDIKPHSSCMSASPQVVGFTIRDERDLHSRELFDILRAKRADARIRYQYASFGRELLYTNWETIDLEKRVEYEVLKADYKDDMFSLGVTLFILISGHYPTMLDINKVNAYGELDYIQMQKVYESYPQYRELLEGLLTLDREKRFSIKDALDAYGRIAVPTLAPLSPMQVRCPMI